jgi:hypothetical protein
MRLRGRTTIPRLEVILANYLRGNSLFEWIDRVTLETLRKVGQGDPPIEVSGELLRSRRIESVDFVRSLPERARLEVHGNKFAVKIDSRFSRSIRWKRFLLAHELAHTFFYEIDADPIRTALILRPGDAALEWLCSYIAKCLLMPTGALQNIFRSEGMETGTLDLAVLLKLSQRFQLPWSIVAERLVEDTGLWQAILLYWHLDASRNSTWRLVWQAVPGFLPNNLFIPIGRRQPSGEMLYPRARGRLPELLNELAASEGTDARPLLRVADLKIGNLQKIVEGNQDFRAKVDWLLFGRDRSGNFDWAEPQKPKSILIAVILSESTAAGISS